MNDQQTLTEQYAERTVGKLCRFSNDGKTWSEPKVCDHLNQHVSFRYLDEQGREYLLALPAEDEKFK